MDENKVETGDATKPDHTNNRALPTVEVTDEGYLAAKNMEGQIRIAKALFVSKMVPKSYDSVEKVWVGMQYAVELGLKPFQGLRNIAIINGQPSIFGELPLGLAIKTGELESIEEFLIDKEYNRITFANKNLHVDPWAAISIIKRKLMQSVECFFSMDEAKDAGLLGKNSPWQTYPKIMLMRRARSQALKIAFPDALSGSTIAEYTYNYIPDQESRDVTHQGEVIENKNQKLNQLFEKSAET